MSGQPQFTPEMVYNLISNNPQGRIFVENLAKLNQMQQAAQQFVPQIQQFAQNPMQAMQNIGNWASETANYMNYQQPQGSDQNVASPIPPSTGSSVQTNQSQGGTPPMGNGMMGMAMDLVGKFEKKLDRIEATVESLDSNHSEIKKFISESIDLQKEIKKTLTDVIKKQESFSSEISGLKAEIAKLKSTK